MVPITNWVFTARRSPKRSLSNLRVLGQAGPAIQCELDYLEGHFKPPIQACRRQVQGVLIGGTPLARWDDESLHQTEPAAVLRPTEQKRRKGNEVDSRKIFS